MLSSTAGAAEYQGDKLGEYVQVGEHGGRPYYRQRDTEESTPNFLYSEGGNWLVSDTLGKSTGDLSNSKNVDEPPLDEWNFWDGKKDRDDDNSLSLEYATLLPCRWVRVVKWANYVAKRYQDDYQGDYRWEEGRWSKGRPIFRRERLSLLVKDTWTIRDLDHWDSTASSNYVESGRATNSPTLPEAGPSVKQGVKRWRHRNYYERNYDYHSSEKLVESDIVVACGF